MRASVAARLGLCFFLLAGRTVDVSTTWDTFCRWDHRGHLTTEYLFWKHLGVEVDERVHYDGIWRDRDADGLVRGKNLTELRRMFPELKVGGELTQEQASVERDSRWYWTNLAPGRGAIYEIFWLGDTTWSVELEDGLGQRLRYHKG